MLSIAFLHRLLEIIRRYRQRSQSRRQLAMLGHDALKDIGLSRAAALEEAAKPFWRA